MSINDFHYLHRHLGHRITCVESGDKDSGCFSVSLECLDCHEVLIEDKKPENAGFIPLKKTTSEVICPKCLEASSLKAWNKATQADYGGEIVPLIEEDFSNHGFISQTAESAVCAYICPCCLQTVVGATIKER